MSNAAIEEFAMVLVRQVRYSAAKSCTKQIRLGIGHVGKRLKEVPLDASAQMFAEAVVADIVDETIFYILHAIDDGSLKLTYTTADGKSADLHEDGLSELAGWYAGDGGWIAMFGSDS
jgi:hypothetical protein